MSVYKDLTCGDCGCNYMGRPGQPCPKCASATPIQKSDDEYTKKVVDDNDLQKGF